MAKHTREQKIEIYIASKQGYTYSGLPKKYNINYLIRLFGYLWLD